MKSLQLQLEEQQAKRNGSEQLIGHLREELERLQSENAEEWGRRERLDAEKQVRCVTLDSIISDGFRSEILNRVNQHIVRSPCRTASGRTGSCGTSWARCGSARGS